MCSALYEHKGSDDMKKQGGYVRSTILAGDPHRMLPS